MTLPPPSGTAAAAAGLPTPAPAPTGPRPVEIRVHGMGNHDPLSSVGTPPRAALGLPPPAGADAANATAASPAVDLHSLPMRRTEVLLANWSRYSRKQAAFWWFLALPFTLANTTAYMWPPAEKVTAARDARGRVSRLGVRRALAMLTTHLVSGLLTVLTTVWLVAIGETILREVRLPAAASASTWATPAVVGVGLASVIIFRLVRRGQSAGRAVSVAHLGLIAITLGVIALGRPARISLPWSDDWWLKPFVTLHWEDPSAPLRDLDVLATATWGAVLVLALWTLVAGVLSLLVRTTDATPTTASVLVVSWFAVGILLAAASLIRLGLSWVVDQAPAHFPFLRPAAAVLWPPECGAIEAEQHPGYCGLTAGNRLVLPFQPPEVDGQVFHMWQDYLPLYVLISLAALAVALTVPHLRTGGSPGPGGCAGERARLVHRTITNASRLLPLTSVAGALTGALLVWWVAETVLNQRSGNFDAIARFGVITLGLVTAAWVLSRGKMLPRVQNVLGMVADILGFWPIRAHPLGGLSYRERVIDDLATTIAAKAQGAPVALIGHSQGSILAAWVVAKTSVPVTALVTCGSPLRSLYAAFFPDHFNEDLFGKVAEQVSRRRDAEGRLSPGWRNYWRDTDPIATPVAAPGETRVVDHPISDVHTPLRGHGDYWVEEGLLDRLDKDLGLPPVRWRERPGDAWGA